jgi:hypothetical protein
MQMDTSEIDRLAADLGDVPALAGPLLNSALQVTAVKVKAATVKRVRNRKHFKQAAAAIDYDVTVFRGFGASVLQVEVGYDKDNPVGDLGNLVEYGAPNSISGPLTPGNELAASLKENLKDFEKGLSMAVADAERKAGI